MSEPTLFSLQGFVNIGELLPNKYSRERGT